MRLYFICHPGTLDWKWQKGLTCPKDCEDLIKSDPKLKEYVMCDFEVTNDFNSKLASGIDIALNRAHNKFNEDKALEAKAYADAEFRKRVAEAEAEGKITVAKTTMSKQALDLFVQEYKVKIETIKQFQLIVDRLKGSIDAERTNEHLVMVQLRPILNEMEVVENRIQFIKVTCREYNVELPSVAVEVKQEGEVPAAGSTAAKLANLGVKV
jgi:hypothetical protein